MTTALIMVALVVAVASWVLVTYNRLTRLMLTADGLWAEVEVALRLRHELVPEFVRAVAPGSPGPREAFRRTALARGTAARSVGGRPRRRGQLEEELSHGISEVLELAAADRDLRSEERFLELRRQLESIEARIETSVRAYNEAVDRLNAAVTRAPSSVVAKVFGFATREPFGPQVAA